MSLVSLSSEYSSEYIIIYNIGTEILDFQCFLTTDMFLFSKCIIPEDSKISRRDLEHVLWNSVILSDLGEKLHAALDWEVTFFVYFELYKSNI